MPFVEAPGCTLFAEFGDEWICGTRGNVKDTSGQSVLTVGVLTQSIFKWALSCVPSGAC